MKPVHPLPAHFHRTNVPATSKGWPEGQSDSFAGRPSRLGWKMRVPSTRAAEKAAQEMSGVFAKQSIRLR